MDSKHSSQVTDMLNRVACSDAHFKHQQRGDPDLTYEEKTQIARAIFDKSSATFLSRFYKFLSAGDLELFELQDSYEVAFYLEETRKRLNDKKCSLKIRNRRFEAMKKMTSQGEYFGEEAMKSRDPLLYEQLVGKYLTDDQIHSKVETKDLGFASVLMQHVQVLQNNKLYEQLKDNEESVMEEEEEEDSSEDEMEDEENQISAADQQNFRDEFLRTMQLGFLNGEDSEHFDYREVDENVEYDSLDIREHDEEEKYFDGDADIGEEDTKHEQQADDPSISKSNQEMDKKMLDVSKNRD